MTIQKKMLITGINGFLGWNVLQRVQSQWNLSGIAGESYDKTMPSWIHQLDLTHYQSLKAAFKTIQPDVVIHLAAMSQPNQCQENQAASYAINVDAAVNLSGLCADRNIPFIFTSTDLVFDGKIHGETEAYSENSQVNPINVYGEHKAIAEEQILERYDFAAICRMPLMFGLSRPPAQSMLQNMIFSLQSNKELSLFCDEYRTPINGQDAARGLLFVLEKKIHGRIHLGGKNRVSRLKIGELLATVMQIKNPQLKSIYQSEVKMSSARPQDVSLNSDRAHKLGFAPAPVFEALQSSFDLHKSL